MRKNFFLLASSSVMKLHAFQRNNKKAKRILMFNSLLMLTRLDFYSLEILALMTRIDKVRVLTLKRLACAVVHAHVNGLHLHVLGKRRLWVERTWKRQLRVEGTRKRQLRVGRIWKRSCHVCRFWKKNNWAINQALNTEDPLKLTNSSQKMSQQSNQFANQVGNLLAIERADRVRVELCKQRSELLTGGGGFLERIESWWRKLIHCNSVNGLMKIEFDLWN